jgi:hypothetical protein
LVVCDKREKRVNERLGVSGCVMMMMESNKKKKSREREKYE